MLPDKWCEVVDNDGEYFEIVIFQNINITSAKFGLFISAPNIIS